MSKARTSIPGIAPNLFWDTDFSSIDWERNAPYVIERVLSRGSWKDFKAMLSHYGRKRVEEAIVKFRYLDKRTLSFCSTYFDIPTEQFRCYNFKQSNPVHWDF